MFFGCQCNDPQTPLTKMFFLFYLALLLEVIFFFGCSQIHLYLFLQYLQLDLYSFNNQIYSYMTDKSETHPALNILSLVRLKPECRITPTRVDFSPTNPLGATQSSITPAFNNDRCFYTAAFNLPADMKHHSKKHQTERSQFEEKIQRCQKESDNLDQLSSGEQLFAALPNSNYCQICQKTFEDYFHHIEEKQHLLRMSQSEASGKIRALCSQFQQAQTMVKVLGKIKLIKKEQKKEEKKIRGVKSTTSLSQPLSTIEGYTITQNHSTGINEEILV